MAASFRVKQVIAAAETRCYPSMWTSYRKDIAFVFLELSNILAPKEVNDLRAIAASAKFVDGKITNPHNRTKNNQQVDYQDKGYTDSARICLEALRRDERILNFAFPTFIAPPVLAKYAPGMHYGAHSDVAFMNSEAGMFRSDISCTIFLEDPAAYTGGELVIYLGTRAFGIKGPPGSGILYPSTMLHEVRQVTSGQRLVAITFIQSQIRDTAKREAVYALSEVIALEGERMDHQNRTRLDVVKNNLLRMWSI